MSGAIQGSDAWLQERLGSATASRFGDILATTKTGYSASRANYLTQLVLERITGQVAESFTNGAMQHGSETEPFARMAFEAHTGLIVEEVGFIKSSEWIGCSPDGLMGAEEGIEIKCPNSATHLETLLAGKMPTKHMAQTQGCMWILNRPRWHFCSFDDRFPRELRLFHTIIQRDQDYIEKLQAEVTKFLAEVESAVKRLSELRMAA